MSSPLRVPPGVDFTFEKRVNDVLEAAKPDYDRLPTLRTELMEHLRERWREGIGQNLSTEAAEEKALGLFGDPESVGRALREPWFKRILSYKRHSAERYLIICVSYLLAAYVSNVGTLLEMENRKIDPKELTDYLIQCFAYSLNILPATLSLYVIRIKKPIRGMLLYVIWKTRHVLWIFPFIFVLNLSLVQLLNLISMFRDNALNSALVFMIALNAGIFLLCLFALACYVKEIKDTISTIKRSNDFKRGK